MVVSNFGIAPSIPGQLTSSGLNGLVDLANKYKDNETIGGLVVGTIADTLKTQVNTGNAIAYNNAFLGTLGDYQQQVETLKKGNALELMSAEGRIAKDINSDNLATDRYKYDKELAGIQSQSDAARYRADQDLASNRARADADVAAAQAQAGGMVGAAQAQASGQIGAAQATAGATKYAAEQQAGAQRYVADQDLAGVKEKAGAERYGYDQQLAGVKEKASAERYGYDQQLAGTKETAGATRYVAEQQAGAQRYSADQELAGVKEQAGAQRYGYDKQFEGTKYTADSEERRIGLTGEENRKTLREQTDQTLLLRADARGAIRRAGSRFYA